MVKLLRGMAATILANNVIKGWAKNPDTYSSAITNAAYVIMEREFAPAADRMKAVIAREKLMPGVLAEARKNLDNPPAIFTQIAIEQVDGNIHFFKTDLVDAFKDVHDAALLADFAKSTNAVMVALADYKKFLQTEVLPKSKGDYALGADTYSKALAANEMIELPLDQLLKIAEADRQKNEDAFQATAKEINPKATAEAVLASLQTDHPAPGALLQTTQDMLDSLRQFIVDHHIVTIPPSDPAHVKETPPFMRSTTTASMDTPGPFETGASFNAYYNMTLPDPRWGKAEQEDYMKGWYYAAISNVSVHEVYPGHYIQASMPRTFPSDVRKVFSANSNVEGWAHYSEKMMPDEGFHIWGAQGSPGAAAGRAAPRCAVHRRNQDAHAGDDGGSGDDAL